MSQRIVIIGGVAAGPKTACRVKRLLPQAEVTLIDEDTFISYGGCGIPYYVSGDIADESALRSTSFHVLRDADFFKRYKGVDVRLATRAVALDRVKKRVLLENVASGSHNEIPYDKLVLATGSRPVILPIEGAELDGVFTVSNLHKAIEIKERIAKGRVARAVVIGGGAIGIEMAEALTDLWGVETTLVEFREQLLPGLVDWSLAAMVTSHLRERGVVVHLGEQAVAITGRDGCATGVKTPQRSIEADLVIMAVGVKARTELAQEAGLEVAEKGGIVVNRRLQTSDPDIYAAGDCIAIDHLISGRKFCAAFGSLANKEGRVVADNLAGIETSFAGAVGSFIMKAFDTCIGAAGLSLQMARAEGYDADFAMVAPADRAHFYPTQSIICCILVFDRKNRKALGVQAFGSMSDNVSARINAAAAYLSLGADIDAFCNIEMAYAPPFSAAVDTLNAVAHVATNLCDGRMRQISFERFNAWMEDFSLEPDWLCLDVRHQQQAESFVSCYPDRWLSMPDSVIRERYTELPRDRTLIIFCNAGSRSYEVQVFLDAVGISNNLVLCGGYNVIKRVGAGWLPQA